MKEKIHLKTRSDLSKIKILLGISRYECFTINNFNKNRISEIGIKKHIFP